jgi:diacylglycerol kinase family enzyme
MTPERATHLLVGNPTAQSGKNTARIKRARQLLLEAGIRSELMATAPGGATIGMVRDALETGDFACVISMGGDGTFREVAAGLLQSTRREEVAMAMLPTGTTNDQGHSFGLEASEESLARNVLIIRGAHETRLDAGQIEALDPMGDVMRRDFFFDSAGWGMSARILAGRNDDRRLVARIPGLRHLYRDHMVYAGATVKSLLGSYVVSDKFVAHIEADGQRRTLTRLSDLVIKATRVYGGAWVFDPTSQHDDGLFEVVPARPARLGRAHRAGGREDRPARRRPRRPRHRDDRDLPRLPAAPALRGPAGPRPPRRPDRRRGVHRLAPGPHRGAAARPAPRRPHVVLSLIGRAS